MKNRNIFWGILMLISACSTGGKVSWLEWEQGEKKVAENGRKAIIWVYDPGCPTCEEAEQRIFNTPKINQYLNQHFIPIKLSGKRKETITMKGKTYTLKEEVEGHQYHELAKAITLAQSYVGYPRIVFMDENMNLIIPINGDIQSDELNLLLHFVAEEQYKKMSIEDYKLK